VQQLWWHFAVCNWNPSGAREVRSFSPRVV
jgi:hypothetical protein